MITRTRIGILAICLQAGVALGCAHGPVEPEQPGVFVLSSVDGEPVPVTRTRESGSTVTVLADTLFLREDGRFDRRIVLRIRQSDGETSESRSVLDGTLRRAGDALVLELRCDDRRFASGLCVPPDTILSTGDALVVRSTLPPLGLKRFDRR